MKVLVVDWWWSKYSFYHRRIQKLGIEESYNCHVSMEVRFTKRHPKWKL